MTKYRLGDVLTIIMDYRGKTPKKLGLDWTKDKNDIVALSAKNLKNGELINLDKSHYGNSALYNKWMKDGDISVGDILMTSEAPLGELFLVDKPIKAILSQRIFLLRPNNSIVLPWYLYFYMSSKNFQNRLNGHATGTTVIGIKQKELRNIEIELPSLSIQKSIVRKLVPISKKIEINKEINANLDELMSEIFERYVTEANVFTTDSLSNIANYKNGLAMQRFRPNGADKGLPVLKIKELNQGFTDSSSDRCSSKISNDVIVKTGDIIFSWSGTLIVKIWTGTTCGLNQHLFKVTSDKYPKWFIYKWTEYYLRQFQSIAAGKATTMGHIKRSDLKQAEVKIPHKSEIDRLDKLISPIFKRYVNNILEINSLKELKNELLSKIF